MGRFINWFKQEETIGVDYIVSIFHQMIDDLSNLSSKLHDEADQLKAKLEVTNQEKARAQEIVNKLKDIVQ